ncbi:MAG: rhodanese-like domain-containing protein [Candidatus Neomarinimicrobiota bacterium]
MKSIDVIELKEKLMNKKIILLDVREQYEIDIANIKGSLNIPMMEVPNRLSELKKEEYLQLCVIPV